MLYNGIRIEADMREGLFWLGKVAAGGNAAGQLSMAKAYEEGKGVAQDNATALVWLNKAAARGSAAAARHLGDAYHAGKLGLTPDLALAEEWRGKAGKMGTSGAPDEWYMKEFFSR